MYDLCGQLGLGEEASKVSQERLVRVYQEAMQSVEGECVKDLLELFMERIDLFWVADSSRIPDMVNKELQVCTVHVDVFRIAFAKIKTVKFIENGV